MSMNFTQDLTKEQQELIASMCLGTVVAQDARTTLFEKMQPLNSSKMCNLARALKQPVEVELNDIGDTKVVRGILYTMTAQGWVAGYGATGEKKGEQP